MVACTSATVNMKDCQAIQGILYCQGEGLDIYMYDGINTEFMRLNFGKEVSMVASI